MSFRNLLEAGDVRSLRRHWATAFPNLPQPKDAAQAEIVMHRARTEAESVSLKARAYSHRWLMERDLPSGLPDRLKPSAERLYPRVANAVGISLNTRNPFFEPGLREVRKDMEMAVLEADADGKIEDAAFVSARMAEAKVRAMRTVFGVR